MADFDAIVNTLIPFILIGAVLFFIWAKAGKHIIKLFEWIKELFKSKKKPDTSSLAYNYIDYDG